MANLAHQRQHAQPNRTVARAIAAAGTQRLAEFLGVHKELVIDALPLPRALRRPRIVAARVQRNSANWQASQFRARSLRADCPHRRCRSSGTPGSVGAGAATDAPSACSRQKGSSKCSFANTATASGSTFASDPRQSPRPLAMSRRAQQNPLPHQIALSPSPSGSEPRSRRRLHPQQHVRAALRRRLSPRWCRSTARRAPCRPL